MGNILSEASFIPQSAPKQAILDYSGTLNRDDLARLEAKAQVLSYKAKVVVLPKDYSPSVGTQEFAHALAKQWNVAAGERLMLVVDLKAHKVRALASQKLDSEGLTGTYSSNVLIPQYFIPYMKQNDLYDAIDSTLTAVNAFHMARQNTVAGTQVPSDRLTYAPGSHPPSLFDGSFLLGFAAVLVAAFVALFAGSYFSRTKVNQKLKSQLEKRVGPLYERADQIGQASEYLATDKNPELAQRVATFFNRLTMLEEARKEVDQLEKQKKIYKVGDGYNKTLRLIQLLEPEAENLRKELNSVTGGVENVPSIDPTAAQILGEDEGQSIKIPQHLQQGEQVSQFRRPSWSMQPQYYQAPTFGDTGGLMGMMLLLNQMETNSRLSQMTMMNQGGGGWWPSNQTNDNYVSDGGGSWGDTSSSSSDDSSWGGDSGGSDSFSDGGGSWGDSGGSDGGGDW